jgi:ubiquinone/menaquinone biosynthesis C-methylase UbiE
VNYFSPKTAAERFARGRPFFHPFIIRKIKEFLAPEKPFRRALDVGCGTGFSTIALKEIAGNIVGIDASSEMISLAPKDERINYLMANGEALPFKSNAFDLITMSQVLHWLDRKTFFSEARRILKNESWIIVYDNYFSSQMPDNPNFQIWHKKSFLEKYPVPPRDWVAFDAVETAKEGFRFIKHEQLENKISFNLKSLTSFLVTMSNVIALVEGGNEKIEEVEDWLARNLKPFFPTENQEFLFNATIWYLQRKELTTDEHGF